jgi:hypothetical protein
MFVSFSAFDALSITNSLLENFASDVVEVATAGDVR